MGRPVQRSLAAGRDGGLVLKAADVGLQAGKHLGHPDDHGAFLRAGRVREVVAYSWPRTSDTARTKWAGSSGPEPSGLAKDHAATATKRTPKETSQIRSNGLGGRRGARRRGRATAGQDRCDTEWRG